MKLEKVVSRPKKALWVTLFVLGLIVAGVLATSYNRELVRGVNFEGLPWSKMILGSLGFIAVLGSLILIFARLLREMKISQVQADFLDRISHELRTPLSTITLVSDLLRSGGEHQETPEESRLWRAHHVELERLKMDVELLLQAARLRESRLRVNLERIDLSRWLHARWDSFCQLLGEHSELKLSGEPLQRSIQADPALFELILRNLLDNARKFALGSPRVEIRIGTIRSRFFFLKSRWRITVVDQGRGFSPDQSSELFRRFARLEEDGVRTRTHSIPGTGLGLYLSASAAKGMGLALTGRSLGEGKGAEFVIEGGFS